MLPGLSRARRGLVALIATTLVAIGLTAGTATASNPSDSPPVSPTTHTVTYDKYSMMIDGKRTYIWSGEFHYWRLPSPSLWLDVLQKMKAEGYNAVSIYFDWAYHSPAPGVYDFTGVRDMDLLLDDAQKAGLYVIARPGPYINAETSGGGFPGWLTTQAGRARSDAPDYLAAAEDWLHHIDPILARHQLTNGTGTVVLDQLENELASTGTSQRNYMQALANQVHADGITVPLFSNDKGRNGDWVPPSSTVPGTVPGPTDLYAFDTYPGGTCHTDGTVGAPSAAPDLGLYGPGGAGGGASASPATPGFTAEFGGGWFDYWGSVGTYPCTAQRQGSGYERVFYATNIANGLTMDNFYMTFGGTSWGWLPAPVVYTSYDYGAAFDEGRQIRPKATTMKELGLFLQSVNPIAEVDKGAVVTPSSSRIRVYHDVNPDTGTHFYIATHNPSSATSNDAFTFTATTADGTYQIPAAGTLRVNGQDSKILVADYDLDRQHLVYSTSQIMTHFSSGDQDIALLYDPAGEDGETVLRYASQPTVTVLSGSAQSVFDPATGDLRLDYVHSGLTEVRISGGGRAPLTLLLADQGTADTFWRPDTGGQPVLVRGPELVRTASFGTHTLNLTGDTAQPADLEVWGAGDATITWNGTDIPTSQTQAGSALASTRLPGATPVTLPDLSSATWRTSVESPESEPSFDDSTWALANKTTTNSTTKPPAGQPVLTADDYGFHQGDVWYRGTYSGDGTASTIAMRYGGGGAGMLQAWLDGVYLGQDVLATNLSSPPTTGTVTLTIPASLRGTGKHELSVMVRDDGHNEDGGVNDAQREGRGLISATFAGATGGADAVPVAWKIQGNQGGENIVDTARGSENIGGLSGERDGWYLPGYPDNTWSTATLPAASAAPGTTWYRTAFPLNVPKDDDASIGITIGDPSVLRSGGNYRALIYVNGWNMGQYIANVGPQHTFVVPNGILDPHGNNTLAIAVTSDGGAGNGLEKVSLTNLGTVRGGVPVTMNTAPAWSAQVYGTPARAGKVTVDSVSTDAGNPARSGDTIHVNAVVTNHGTAPVTRLAATLDAPAGWTVTGGDLKSTMLAGGASTTVGWTVAVASDAGTATDQLAAMLTYTGPGGSMRTGATARVDVRSRGDQYISDLPWVSSTDGFGPVERDQSIGGSGSGDGGALTLRGTVYPKGLGTNSVSQVVLDVPAGCTSFTSDVGIDDAAAGRGTVTFAVLADGAVVASTGTLTGGSPVVHLTADVTGASVLTLQVGDAGDGNGHDNADWADAQLHCAG
ncbi:beta-galactosidase [Rugosimonospora acidiphila]|uniref:beta-galactosidase n=1 Tax=Rugosimonospora acidiphila TaxID=556531 RepID=A0ABP9RRZ4_9ACTN